MLHSVSSHAVQSLRDGWQLTNTPPDACSHPAELAADAVDWRAATVPGTVAMVMLNDKPDPWEPAFDYDSVDWWYQCQFAATGQAPKERVYLHFAGLATLAEVWLNGECVLKADNMFCAYELEVTHSLKKHNELAIVFRSVAQELSRKKPRPRWKTRLVEHQQLRWIRTTLLGRIPAWTPALKPVGPWREISLRRAAIADISRFDLRSTLVGNDGHVDFHCELSALDSGLKASRASLNIGGQSYPLDIEQQTHDVSLTADLSIKNVPTWWPHTHGEPRLLDCTMEVDFDSSSFTLDCGKIGFKSVALKRANDQVQFVINGEPVFCRGACWTINDFASLSGSDEQLRQALMLARNAGVNMLRIGGTMVYESDHFYELCDELGILVWQDFMFANMDYPVDDAAFMENVNAELEYQLQRLQPHVCIAAYCGNSEVEQQAAMFGAPREIWSNDLFANHLPALCAKYDDATPYFPSTPCEGALPFHVSNGLAHYYGVGAYQRPMHDLVAARVKFTPECLGFSNVPDTQTISELTGMEAPPPHQPLWKRRVPRDGGAGWDFEDIRDYYLKELFAEDAVKLRYADLERYFDLSKVVTGEVMASTFAYWRSTASECAGGLVWFYKDLWSGAGWGILDSDNRPKPVYYYLRRVWAATTILVNDMGLDGLALSVVNETAQPLLARVEITLLQTGKTAIASAGEKVELPARSVKTMSADAMFGHFLDVGYAYKFGPPKHNVVACLLMDDANRLIADNYYFPSGLNLTLQQHVVVDAQLATANEDELVLKLSADCFLQSVRITVRDYLSEDNYFHLPPGYTKIVSLRKTTSSGKSFRGHITALNLRESIVLKL